METTMEVIGSVYLHIDNGGIKIQIQNGPDHGPILAIQSSHFGNNVHTQKIAITKEGLLALAELLEKALDVEYLPEYSWAAQPQFGSIDPI
jgi:hypothetical protein